MIAFEGGKRRFQGATDVLRGNYRSLETGLSSDCVVEQMAQRWMEGRDLFQHPSWTVLFDPRTHLNTERRGGGTVEKQLTSVWWWGDRRGSGRTKLLMGIGLLVYSNSDKC